MRLLFACRPLDYSQRLDAGRHTRLPEIEVQAMEPERIEDFIHNRFDDRIAGHVWAQLQDQGALELYSSPYSLNLLLEQIDTKAQEIQVPRNRAALFSGMARARLRRECQKDGARFADAGLLSERDRTVLMRGKTRGHWLPDETPLFEALAALAFHIQDAVGGNERWGSLRWKKARRVIAHLLEGDPDADRFLHAGYDLGLFEDEAAQSGDIRFVHQQIQEYFAAWVLAEDFDPDKLAVSWRSDDLPELPTTGWEETTLMAASRGRGEWRRYAWPGEFDPLRANTAETRLGVTTPVGVFPEGATPDTGLLDLCGNVWEWTATPWSEGDAWVPDARAHLDEPVGRPVVRGGSWDDARANARLGYRNRNDPGNRNNTLDFRVCRASHISIRLLMAVRNHFGPRARRVVRPGPASNIMTRLWLGIAAQSV